MYLVYEVSSFGRPTIGQLVKFNLHLLSENVFSDFFTIASIIWPSPKHKLVAHYSQCEVVSSKCMIFVTDDFWSHVTWGPTRVLMVVIPHYPRHSKVSDA